MHNQLPLIHAFNRLNQVCRLNQVGRLNSLAVNAWTSACFLALACFLLPADSAAQGHVVLAEEKTNEQNKAEQQAHASEQNANAENQMHDSSESQESAPEPAESESQAEAEKHAESFSEADIAKMKREASALSRNHYTKEALDLCEQILKARPDDLDTIAIRGKTRLEKREFKEALCDLDKVLVLPKYENNGSLLVARANASLMLDNYEAARRDCDRAIKQDPKKQEYYLIRGLAFYRSKSYQKALEDYNKAIELDPQGPNLTTFLTLRSDAYNALNRPADAVKDLSKVLKLKGHDPGAWMNRASFYFLQKDWKNAVSDLDQVINWAPMGKLSNEALIMRAEARSKSEDYKGSIEDYSSLLAGYPDELKYLFARAQGRLKLKEDLDKALKDIDKCLKASPEEKSFIELKNEILNAGGK